MINQKKNIKISVIGQGYVGLPMSIVLATKCKNYKILGIEKNNSRGNYLKELIFLQDIPPWYIIADDNLLPQKTIRTFRFNHKWMESLWLGALSLSGRAEITYKMYQNIHSELKTYIPWGGFFLHSDLVWAYPEMEIKAKYIEPNADDNKSLASAWFVFSIFVVISQIVSQVTTKGEKAMKFVKYLAREFGAMDKSKRPLNQRVLESERLIYEITYKFYNKLRELDDQDVLTQGYEDLTLGELVTKIKEFYTDDLSIDSSADSGADYRYIEQGLGSIQQGPAIEGAFAAAHTGGDSNESRVSLIMQDTLL